MPEPADDHWITDALIEAVLGDPPEPSTAPETPVAPDTTVAPEPPTMPPVSPSVSPSDSAPIVDPTPSDATAPPANRLGGRRYRPFEVPAGDVAASPAAAPEPEIPEDVAPAPATVAPASDGFDIGSDLRFERRAEPTGTIFGTPVPPEVESAPTAVESPSDAAPQVVDPVLPEAAQRPASPPALFPGLESTPVPSPAPETPLPAPDATSVPPPPSWMATPSPVVPQAPPPSTPNNDGVSPTNPPAFLEPTVSSDVPEMPMPAAVPDPVPSADAVPAADAVPPESVPPESVPPESVPPESVPPTPIEPEPEVVASAGGPPTIGDLGEGDIEELDDQPGPVRVLAEWIAVFVGAFLVAIILRYFVIQSFYIPSESMESTLTENDRVLVNKLSYRLHDVNRGDVIVFRRDLNTPGDTDDLIKRVIGLPGESVEIRDGAVYIDGLLLDEPYLDPDVIMDNYPSTMVPEDEFFVMGDNRDQSFDSRWIGTIPRDRIVGRAFVLFWPLNRVDAL